MLVVSRIDLATGQEVVVGFNNGQAAARVSISTATPGATWSIAFGSGVATGGVATGSLTLTIPAVSATLAVPGTSLPKTVRRNRCSSQNPTR